MLQRRRWHAPANAHLDGGVGRNGLEARQGQRPFPDARQRQFDARSTDIVGHQRRMQTRCEAEPRLPAVNPPRGNGRGGMGFRWRRPTRRALCRLARCTRPRGPDGRHGKRSGDEGGRKQHGSRERGHQHPPKVLRVVTRIADKPPLRALSRDRTDSKAPDHADGALRSDRETTVSPRPTATGIHPAGGATAIRPAASRSDPMDRSCCRWTA